MRKRVGIPVTAIVAMLGALALPSAASASVEFGDSCVANNNVFKSSAFLFEVSNPANPIPTAAPTAGVITKWKFSVVPFPGSYGLKFQAIHLIPPNQAEILGESTVNVVGGLNTIDTRIPVKAGDRIAESALSGEHPLLCESESKSTIGAVIADSGNGGAGLYLEAPNFPSRVPLAAVLEPDADHDGYGDESQDKCPQLASTQGPCPPVVLEAISQKGKGSVSVLVVVNETAPVTVTGTVKLGKGRTAKLKAPTKSLAPGPIGKFKLKFTSALKSRLKELGPGQSLQLKISAQATNPAGALTTDDLKMKLKG